MESETQRQYERAWDQRRRLERGCAAQVERQYTEWLNFARQCEPHRHDERGYPLDPDGSEDPLSRCMVAERSPCRPGTPCPYDTELTCTPDCGEYAQFSEDAGGDDR